MYLSDLINRLIRKSNIPIISYLVINVFVIAGIVSILFSKSYGIALVIGFVLYAISLVIALSPLGETILRYQTGCKAITRTEQINFLEPIFREVYDKARELDPSIPDDVKLYINDEEAPNAFATGRKTICVTEGLLHTSEDQIKATLGHEFGHIAHKDTDLVLLVSVGNLIISAVIFGIKIIVELLHFLLNIFAMFAGGQEGAMYALVSAFYHAMITAVVGGLHWIWSKIGVILVMKSSRDNEFLADEFSFNLGYGNELCMLLDSLTGTGSAKGLFANLASSHPDKNDRIARLQALGATYRAKYGEDSN